MNTELSTNLDFRKPSHYFRISREEDEALSGKYFSHITRVPWEEMG